MQHTRQPLLSISPCRSSGLTPPPSLSPSSAFRSLAPLRLQFGHEVGCGAGVAGELPSHFPHGTFMASSVPSLSVSGRPCLTGRVRGTQKYVYVYGSWCALPSDASWASLFWSLFPTALPFRPFLKLGTFFNLQDMFLE